MHSNNYKSIRNIGGGNFGRVDLVYNTSTNKQYVMKVPQDNNTEIKAIIDIKTINREININNA